MINLVTTFADACTNNTSFFGLPHWYEYLKMTQDGNGICSPAISSLGDVWLIVAAVIEILLRVAALVAVGVVIYGGIRYATSQGNPDETSKAQSTIIDALIGLAIAVLAATLVGFVAGSFKS